MRVLLLAACLMACFPSDCAAQTQDFQSVRHQLFCNVYDYLHADASTVEFLKANFPYLARPKPAGGLYMPPVGRNSKKEIVSMNFRQHPFFHFKMKEGRVDFHAVIMSADSKFERGADLWLLFENEQDAKAAFKIITDTLAGVSKKKRMADKDGQTVADFFENEQENSGSQLEAILKLDEKTHTYSIFLPDSLD